MNLESYVLIDEAAQLESINYETLKKKIQRNVDEYKTKTFNSDVGGRPRVLVSVNSLSKKARRAWKVKNKSDEDIENAPWYVYADYAWYKTKYSKYFYKGIELSRYVREYLDYKGKNKTDFATSLAKKVGLSRRSFLYKVELYIEASAWAVKLEQENEESYEFIKSLAVCRRPRVEDTFPTLHPELKVYIENILYDKEFQANNQTYTNLYDEILDIGEMKGIEVPSYDTVWRYAKMIEDEDGDAVKDLIGKGLRYWKNRWMSKKYRNTGKLKVLEVLQGDVHTFDFWVAVKRANGKMQAIRPCLVAWLDTRSRALVGWRIAEAPDAQIMKESVINAFYPKKNVNLPYGVPKYLLIDNGKEYTAETLTGRPRTVRFTFDDEAKGFYRSLGVEDDMRSLPYQPWSKAQIERFFGTVCTKFSKRINSYTGTLTGSKTSAKVQKDIKKMLKNGELMGIEEAEKLFEDWVVNVYHKRRHRGLMIQGEEVPAPIGVFNNGERYFKAAPPLDFAIDMLVKTEERVVRNIGIVRTIEGKPITYTHEALHKYKDKKVSFRYDPKDITKIYVYNQKGEKICEAVSYELLSIGPKISEKALEEHVKTQKRELRGERETIKKRQMTYEEREEAKRIMLENADKKNVGPELRDEPEKIVAIPDNKQYRDELKEKKVRKSSKKIENEYFEKQKERVFAELQKLG